MARAAVTIWGYTREPSPTVTRRLAQTLSALGLRPTVRLWDRGAMLGALGDPGAASQIGYARWRNDFPDGADWFSLLLAGSSIRPGGNLNYALLDDDRSTASSLEPRPPGSLLRAERWWQVERAVAALAPGPPSPTRSARTSSPRVRRYVAHQLYGFLWMRARVG